MGMSTIRQFSEQIGVLVKTLQQWDREGNLIPLRTPSNRRQFAEIVRQLGYKAQQVVRIPPFYPSSKTCNGCGYLNRELTLADRTWTCPSCGAILDRDRHAAQNIRDEGMRLVGVG